jgi:hypothetical protein
MVPALHEQAKALRELDAIVDMAGATAVGAKVRIAASKASSAWDAAWDAAEAAAWAAAGAAAWAAAGDAAWAAAGDAAWAAAWAAAAAAAWDAAGDALKPTTQWLQASAAELVKSMCEVKA